MRKLILTMSLLFFCLTGFAQWNYPPTKKVDVVDTYFGVDYTDNYRWLEELIAR